MTGIRKAAERNEAQLLKLYKNKRRAAYALALASLSEGDSIYRLLTGHFVQAGKRISRKSFREEQVLRGLYRALPEKPGHVSSQYAWAEKMSGLDKRSRNAWALVRAADMAPDEAMALMGLDKAAFEAALSRADKALDQPDVAGFEAVMERQAEKREIWSDISFELRRQMRFARYAWVSLAALVCAVALFFLGREAYYGVRILRFPGARQEAVLSDGQDSAEYYKRFVARPSTDYPRISESLYARLENLPDEQRMRVAFRFYDSDLMASITEQGESLLSLHTSMYEQGLSVGKLNTLLANAVKVYYANYQRPFMPEEREADFVSDYESIYAAALSLAEGSGFKGTVEAYPEVFGSREAFEAVLYSPSYMYNILYPAAILLGLEQNLSPDTREEYERQLFAFTNPLGSGGELSVDSFFFNKKQTDRFYTLREKLGKAYYSRNVALCQELLPDALMTSDILEGNESSLFSAVLSKAEIFDLAENDARFVFLGIATPYEESFPNRLEHGLSDYADRQLFERRPVYQIDEEYMLYSVNYAAPLTLPQGFIDQLRQTVPCEDTSFEMQLQYNYHMRYAHPQTRSGYSLLRAVYSNPSLQFCSGEFKPFSRMGRF